MNIKDISKENMKKAFKGRGKRGNEFDDEESTDRPLVTDMKNITFDDNGRTIEVK